MFRTAPNGQLLIELVAQLVQTDQSKADDPAYDGLAVRGGCTLIVGVDGVVRYVIFKPLPGPHLDARTNASATARLELQRTFVDELDRRDPQTPYIDPAADEAQARMRARMSLRALHDGR